MSGVEDDFEGSEVKGEVVVRVDEKLLGGKVVELIEVLFGVVE